MNKVHFSAELEALSCEAKVLVPFCTIAQLESFIETFL